MLKHISQFVAYLLLALMPLQSFAATNMTLCNSLAPKHTQAMPCHENMAEANATPSEKHHADAQASCKASCAALCANLCAMVALNNTHTSLFVFTANVLADFSTITYTSITIPNPQRPPIYFS